MAHARVVDLRFSKPEPRLPAGTALIQAIVEGRRIVYDTNDDRGLFGRGTCDGEDFDRELDAVAAYFKRSCDLSQYARLRGNAKIKPLGLCYRVSSRNNTVDRGLRPFNARQLVRGAAERNRLVTSILGVQGGRRIWLENYEHPPEFEGSPTVLFSTRLWDPGEVSNAAAQEQRGVINQMRIDCLRAAREAFGPRFVGGLAWDEFARAQAPDCLLPSESESGRSRFLHRVRRAAVCVATTGLHDSIGFKMAEYAAASRAIVSEPLFATLPGSFTAGVNYLEFTSPDAMVRCIELLLEDPDRRAEMMRANRDYYRTWVRPDSLVLQTLRAVLPDVPPPTRS